MMLAVIDYYTTQIEALTATIEELTEPYLHQAGQIDAVPGIGLVCAQDIIAEIGVDMAVFPTAAHLVSWARWSPQVKQSAGKRKGSNSTGRGNPYLGAALGEAGIGAARTPSFLGARYRRLAKRMPKRKPWSRPETPCSPSFTPCSPTPAPATTTSDPAITSSAAHPPSGPQPHPQPGTPRLPSHHPGHRPRHRRTPNRDRLTPHNKTGGATHRLDAAARPAGDSFSDQPARKDPSPLPMIHRRSSASSSFVLAACAAAGAPAGPSHTAT